MWKRPTIPPQEKTIPWNPPDDSKNITTNKKYKRQRGRPRKTTKEIQLDYKKSQDIIQKRVTKTIKPSRESNNNLRSAQNANKTEINTTKQDVRENGLFAHNTITQAHLPFNTLSTQQPNSSNYEISKQQMDNSNMDQPSRTTGSPSPRKAFSMSNYLSPTHKHPASEKDERDDQLPKPLEDIFNTQLIAALTNRDTILREEGDCILTGDEHRSQEVEQANPCQVEEPERT